MLTRLKWSIKPYCWGREEKGDLYSNNCPPSWRETKETLVFSVSRDTEKHRIIALQNLLHCVCGGFKSSKMGAQMPSVPNNMQ